MREREREREREGERERERILKEFVKTVPCKMRRKKQKSKPKKEKLNAEKQYEETKRNSTG